MSALTKSWLQKQITDLEATRDEITLGLDEDGNNTLAALKLALAGMEAEPVAYIGERMLESLTDGARSCGRVWHAVTDELSGERRIPLYDTPQPLTTSERAELENYRNAQQVVPDEMRNKLKAEALAEMLKDARDYAPLTSGQWENLANNWHQTFVGLSGDDKPCRAAMLQGAEPVTTGYKLDGGENCWSCGMYFTYEQHSECDGYCPHCDSPVDLDDDEEGQSSKVVPLEPTDEMISNAWREAIGKCDHETIKRIWLAMLAAAPQQEAE